jgi:hypothetical protein
MKNVLGNFVPLLRRVRCVHPFSYFVHALPADTVATFEEVLATRPADSRALVASAQRGDVVLLSFADAAGVCSVYGPHHDARAEFVGNDVELSPVRWAP